MTSSQILEKTTTKEIKLEKGVNSAIEIIELIPKQLHLNKDLFEKVWNQKPIEQGKVNIFGKLHDVPRYQQLFGDSYYFSGVSHESKPIEHAHPFLQQLMKWVCEHSGKSYSQMLVNYYENGKTHYISAHSDDESQLVPGSDIYSFSFGETRDFVVTCKNDKQFRLVIPMYNNSLIIMKGEMQKFYKHAVPKRVNATGKRINVTMRLFRK